MASPYRAPLPVERGTIGVFAPSSPFPEDRYAAGKAVLEARGWSLVEPEGLDARQGYLAGGDDHRLGQFHRLLSDPAIDVLWAARGGYGAHRIAGQIDARAVQAASKPIVGFSDLCALHAVAQSRAGLISVHGPVITQLGTLPATDIDAVEAVLAGRPVDVVADGPAITGGLATGPVLGGCLSVIAPLIGTGLLPDLTGAILLLEDVGEASYRVDRLLTHLRGAGLFDRVAAVAVGDFVGCEARNPDEPSVDAVLAERLGDLGVPVLTGLPFGHGHRNLAIPLGAVATLDADRGTLRFGA